MLLTAQAAATDTGSGGGDRNTHWVRLIPPGVDDPSARIGNSTGGHLAGVIKGLLQSSRTELAAIDLLCYRGIAHQEYLLRPCRPPAVTVDSALPILTNVGFATIHSDVADPNALTARFACLLADAVIGRIGIEIVHVDPTPLGRTPTLTTRLLTSSTSSLTFDRDAPASSLATYLDDLIGQAIPHVSRTIIAPAGPASYQVEQQLGLFTPDARSLSRVDLARHLQADTGPSLAAYYTTDAVTSTWAQLTEAGWQAQSPRRSSSLGQPTVHCRARETDAATTLYELCTSGMEYRRLLGTLGDPAPLETQYETLAYEPTLTVDGESLATMLGLVWGYDEPCWDHQVDVARRPPILQPLALVREAPGTDQTAGHVPRVPTGDAASSGWWAPGRPTADDWPRTSLDTSQLPSAHEAFTHRAVTRLREYGDEISAADERFSDVPWVSFCRTPPTAETSALVCDPEGSIPPGELVAAASHATPEHSITVATASQDAAERAVGILREPFLRTDDTETVLYPRHSRYWIRQGYVAAVPRTQSPLRWTIDPAGDVRLYAGDDIVARGSVWDGSLSPVTPGNETTSPLCWIDTEPSPSVYTADGTARHAHYEERAPLRDRYWSVPLPAVPARRWWVAQATAIVLGDDGPAVYDPLRELGSRKEALDTTLSPFLETFTCSIDHTLAATTLARAFYRYLFPQSIDPPPNSRAIATALADLPRRETGPSRYESTGRDIESLTFTHRGWLYPQVTADRPAAPFAEATADGTAAASLANSLGFDTIQ